MTITMTPETVRIVGIVTSRFFVIQTDGTIRRLNEYGKAIEWCYNQKKAALRCMMRQHSGSKVWDKATASWVQEEG